MKQPHSEKLFHQKNISPNIINLEIYKIQNKSPCLKLQPLNRQNEANVHNAVERELSHQLNPVINKCSQRSEQPKRPSKIPVLKRKKVNAPDQNAVEKFNATLSAADRRQKFYQSHLSIKVVPPINPHSVKNEERKLPYKELVSCHGNCPLPKVLLNSISTFSPKYCLPPIKHVNVVTVSEQKKNQSKSKCMLEFLSKYFISYFNATCNNSNRFPGLLGEITHFPALCNHQCTKPKNKQNYISAVPHLPPIQLLPLSPPSISSLEHECPKTVKGQM